MGEGEQRIHLFLSHVHWDHIQGFPFFMPALKPGNTIHIYGTENADNSLSEILAGQMEGPHFPLSIAQMGGTIFFHDVKEGATIQIKDSDRVLATVQNARLNHPNGVVGYRLCDRASGKTFVFATDTEHYADHIDENLVRLCHDADLLIYDGQYTPSEYLGGNGVPCHKGWGHSTWEKGVEVALKAGVRRLIITHHDPSHDDAFLQKLEQKAREALAERKTSLKIEWAYEGMSVTLK